MLSVVAALSSLSQSFFLFEAKFDFWGFECKLYGPLKNAPIPQEVKGSADGDSLRQLFFVFGLDFRVCAWYCTALLSDAGDVPVPVLPTVRHDPPAFLRNA